MKIVINACFGGFGLSAKATKRLAEIQGRDCYFFQNPDHDFRRYEQITIEEANKSFFWIALDTPNVDQFETPANWSEMSLDDRKAWNFEWSKHLIDGDHLERNDPLLIQIVEELGVAANGSCAQLKVIEIPDGTDWVIEEYDGNEWVSETHNTWS